MLMHKAAQSLYLRQWVLHCLVFPKGMKLRGQSRGGLLQVRIEEITYQPERSGGIFVSQEDTPDFPEDNCAELKPFCLREVG